MEFHISFGHFMILSACFVTLVVAQMKCSEESAEDEAPFVFYNLNGEGEMFKLQNLRCDSGWDLIGTTCVAATTATHLTWRNSNAQCKNKKKGAELASFDDEQDLTEAQIHLTNSDLKYSVWVGGNKTEKRWSWLTGRPMPMGASFWGRTNGTLEPINAPMKTCVFMDGQSEFLLLSDDCANTTKGALCLYDPYDYQEDNSGTN